MFGYTQAGNFHIPTFEVYQTALLRNIKGFFAVFQV